MPKAGLWMAGKRRRWGKKKRKSTGENGKKIARLGERKRQIKVGEEGKKVWGGIKAGRGQTCLNHIGVSEGEVWERDDQGERKKRIEGGV